MSANPRIKPIETSTRRQWDDWMQFLNGIDAENLSHKDIAAKVFAELEGTMESAAWWSQSIAVAYEHAIGRRIPGQRSDGTFQMSISRSTHLGLEDLMARWVGFATEDSEVQSLLADAPRTSGTDKRKTWRAPASDGSSILVTSEPKKDGTASIVATQRGMATPEENDAARQLWTAVLARFLGQL